MELWFTMENYCTIEKNYGTMDKTMVLYWELWNFDLRWKKHGRLPKTKKLWFITGKLWKYTKRIEVLNRFIEFIGSVPKTMELWFTMKKNYGTMEKTMVL